MRKRKILCAAAVMLVIALLAADACFAAGSKWQQVYRQLITSGDYQTYLSPNVPASWGEQAEWKSIFYGRDTAWDAFALHDLDGDGTPELIVKTEYAMEQADIFTVVSGRAVRLGAMGGDNFFQDIIYYDNFGYRGLFTVMGGPMMTITRYTLSGGSLSRQDIGTTQVDANGDYTVGIRMEVRDSALYDLLYGTFVGYRDVSRSLVWFRSSDLKKDSDWTVFFNTSLN